MSVSRSLVRDRSAVSSVNLLTLTCDDLILIRILGVVLGLDGGDVGFHGRHGLRDILLGCAARAEYGQHHSTSDQ